MKTISLNIQDAVYFAGQEKFDALRPAAAEAISMLDEATGKGSGFLGWVRLPSETPDELIGRIEATAERLRSECEFVVCIGIGGSYL